MNNLDKLTTLVQMDEIEEGAQQQIFKELENDFLLKMAIMPDVHQGYTLPIGAVALLDGFISPEYVGYDIGCGMTFYNTAVNVNDMFPDERAKIYMFNKVYEEIPTGMGGNRKARYSKSSFRGGYTPAHGDNELTNTVKDLVDLQYGTLGSGNHFIEIGTNKENEVCITIHSGSRGVGWKTAQWYMKQGKFLEVESDLGQAYLADMNYFLNYALGNRETMLRAMVEDVMNLQMRESDFINENHNHAEIIDDGVIHRKGATQANYNQMGVIPISMRDGVYITQGLGNPTYLNSSSHGAGRRMSRTKAKKEIELTHFQEQMKGIVAKVEAGTIDESPDAYKDPIRVIEAQEGVVLNVVDIVKPIINIKAVDRKRRRR